METMFMQSFGGTNEKYYDIFESGLLSRYFAQPVHLIARCKSKRQ